MTIEEKLRPEQRDALLAFRLQLACPHDEKHPEDAKCPGCGQWVPEALPRSRPDFTTHELSFDEAYDGMEGEAS